MAKLFLGSVGTVEAFEKVGDKYELAFVSKTLTDSGINSSISREDIRGGSGAPVQFSFYHDPNVEITLTDVVFKKEYLEGQLGTTFEAAGAHSYKNETVKCSAAGSISLSEQPISLDFGACGGDISVIWATEEGKDEWKAYEFTAKTVTSEDFKANKKYCVRYCVADPKALIARVTTNILPKEYMLIITAPVFSGDACASNGKRAGTITYEIPRFRLNGGSEMAFNMSSNQTMNLAGVAYASETCDLMEASLYNIVLSLDDGSLGVKELIVDEDTLKKGLAPKVYGLLNDGRVSLLSNEQDLIFAPALVEGKFSAAGAVNIKYKLNETIVDDVTVAA